MHHKLHEPNRRAFLAQTAKTCFGLSIGGKAASFFSPAALAADGVSNKGKNVIYLFMSGGMSHLDTFDPKPDTPDDIKGTVEAIGSNVDGIQLGHCLPLVAKQMDKIAVIRAMNTTQGAHEQGRYSMRTSYNISSSIVHPAIGSWISSQSLNSNTSIPSYVNISTANDHPGAGFLEPTAAPLPIGSPSDGLQNIKRLQNITEKEFNLQLALRKQLDRDFHEKFHKRDKTIRAYNHVFEEAVSLMQSEDIKAFDLNKEAKTTHDLYGSEKFSKGVLLARRLVEHGARFVEVEFSGFDWHTDNFEEMETKIPILDQALAALLADLESRGLLDSTLVVLATEFGRTPTINANSGRDHYPQAFSCLMAGGGIKGGQVIGETDQQGSKVIGDSISSADFNATIAQAAGFDPGFSAETENKQPFRLSGRKGKVIPGIL